MSALSKKLLSWLCVAAMVLAMVPAVALPASAEEIEAASAVEYGTANLPEGTQTIIDAAKAIQDADLAAHVEAGTCPIHGAVTWVEATYPKQTAVEGEVRHYYVKDSTAVQKQYNWYAGNAKNMTLCLALLNTTTPKEIGGMIGLRNAASGGTINIMGSGTITSDGTKTADSQFGVVCLQGSGNTLNLYGGTFIYTGDGQGRTKVVTDNGDGTSTTTYTPSGTIGAGAITVKGKTNTVNIFDGVNIGPETQDLTKPCFNVVVQLASASSTDVVNMYGGTIRNGVSNLANTSGNIHMHYDKSLASTKPTFNMYGGTVTGGAFVEGTSSANGGNIYGGAGAQINIHGGTITGGKATYGGNIFLVDSGVTKFVMDGGIIENGEATYGGNISATAKITVTGKALIQNGVALTNNGVGGNVFVRGGSRSAFIEGGKITGGKAENGGGGNVFVGNKATTISGGIIEKGTAKYGGNISTNGVLLTISGGTIQDGTATSGSGGGNIYGTYNNSVDGDETIVITGGIIQNGVATSADGGGGNLRINNAATSIGGDAQILGGEAGFMGGSIYITTGCVATIDGNAVISGGRTNNKGGNIALYNGDLTIGGNAQVSDGKATRYTVTRDDEGTITKENHIADGGNIYCFGYSQTIDEVKTYTNELTIKDSAVISGGWAVRGGNISAENTTVNIESGVQVKDGCAGLEVDGEMTYTAEKDTVGRGGNIHHSTKECEVNIAATLSGGKARFGGNLAVYGGEVNFSGVMENGNTTSFGGNAIVQAATLNLDGAELRKATSNGQGGNIRAYSATINMNGGAIYGGDDLSKNNTDNVWLVRSTLNMSGDATVTGNDAFGSAVRLVAYSGYPSVVTLADTATVVGETKDIMSVQENGDGDQSILYITEGWAGTAYITTTDAYSYGDTIDNDTVVVGSFAEDGTFTKGGTYTGTLLRAGVGVFGMEGDAVLATAGFVAEDGTKSWYMTNNEALAAYQHSENAYVILTGATAEIPEAITELNVNIAGGEVTVSGAATVYGSDSSNDDYSGNGKLIPAEGAEITVEPVVMRGDNRYIAVQDEAGAWSFHRLAMWMSAVTLRTEGNPGIYYKATYQCDKVLRDLVDSYGVALSLQDMPGADFETADKYTAYGTEDFAEAYSGNKVNTVSGAVVGIMKERNSKEVNTANANREIYANAYLKLNIGEEGLLIMADSVNQGKTSDAEDFTGTAYSLFEVLDGVNENWDNYSDEDKATIASFLETWADNITDEAAAQLQTQLDNIFGAA